MATYRRLSWGSGPVTAEKLNAMVENTDFLYENLMRGHFNNIGLVKENNLRIQGMTCPITQDINNVSHFSNMYWAKPFSPGCSPIITFGHFFTEKLIHSIGMRNINGGVFPDNAGFRIEIYAGDAGYGPEWKGEHWYPAIGLGW